MEKNVINFPSQNNEVQKMEHMSMEKPKRITDIVSLKQEGANDHVPGRFRSCTGRFHPAKTTLTRRMFFYAVTRVKSIIQIIHSENVMPGDVLTIYVRMYPRP